MLGCALTIGLHHTMGAHREPDMLQALLGADTGGINLACAVGPGVAKGCGDGRQCGKKWSVLGVLHLINVANAWYSSKVTHMKPKDTISLCSAGGF